jgi:LemA protein
MTILRLRHPLPPLVAVLLMLLAPLLAGCGINTIPTLDEQVNAAWAQVQNQYQRRADLIPNLVETVKGYAEQERAVLTEVTEARARVGQLQLPPDIVENKAALRQFEQS